ncbi:MAG: hypothetical protein IJW29_04475 [Clostridia bacterium]|nr:hypothetical protein [Clostridia bacterium]
MFEFFKKKAGDAKAKNGKLLLLILGAAVGVLLLLFGGSSEKQEETVSAEPYKLSKDEVVIYQRHLEKEIRTLCESVRGVENVTVAVTLSGGFESVYATEWKGGDEEYVIIGSGSSATALYLTRSTPKIEGIGIVCRGGGTESVRNELIPLLAATYHISSHRIYITEAG